MSNINNSFFHRKEEPEAGTLYLVGTPIGNINDFSPRAKKILENVSIIACEDTRRTRKLLKMSNISNQLISFHKHNLKQRGPNLLRQLANGESVALVSDAGLPLISDPGESLVNSFRDQGGEIISIPGPCAALNALITSGLDCSSFIFEGFLPRKNKEFLIKLEEIASQKRTIIIYESPHRLINLLEALSNTLQNGRRIHIAREMTKKYEEHIFGDIKEILDFFKGKKPLGEFTIIIEGVDLKEELALDENALRSELKELIKLGLSNKNASIYLSQKTGLPKRDLYKLIKNN
tara:strand:+ start:2180 stop:3055 length:876 start_codon:yes stop_codon:yes gene_type:complete